MMKPDHERVKTLLAEAITVLCKSGLNYSHKFSIQGLLGITVDDHEIFLVDIHERVSEKPAQEETFPRPVPICRARDATVTKKQYIRPESPLERKKKHAKTFHSIAMLEPPTPAGQNEIDNPGAASQSYTDPRCRVVSPIQFQRPFSAFSSPQQHCQTEHFPPTSAVGAEYQSHHSSSIGKLPTQPPTSAALTVDTTDFGRGFQTVANRSSISENSHYVDAQVPKAIKMEDSLEDVSITEVTNVKQEKEESDFVVLGSELDTRWQANRQLSNSTAAHDHSSRDPVQGQPPYDVPEGSSYEVTQPTSLEVRRRPSREATGGGFQPIVDAESLDVIEIRRTTEQPVEDKTESSVEASSAITLKKTRRKRDSKEVQDCIAEIQAGNEVQGQQIKQMSNLTPPLHGPVFVPLDLEIFTSESDKQFVCVHCGKAFRLRHQLKVHMKMHTDERPFPCKMCTKAFRQKSDLKAHMMIHTGEKPYLCNKCGRAFRHAVSRKKHMKTHR